MVNNTSKNDIDPRLEQLLKNELANRAKKIDAMKKWQQQKDSEIGKKTENNKLKIIYGTISSIAAVFIVGFFLFHNDHFYNGNYSPNPLDEVIIRGALVDPSIYEAIDAGDTAKAINLIDSSLQVCSSRLIQLKNMEVSDENIEEIEEMQKQLEEELKELKSLSEQMHNK